MTALRRRGRIWFADLYVGGRRVRESLGTDSKFQAQHRLRERESELRSQAGEGDMLFADFCDRYLAWAKTTKPASVAAESLRLEKIKRFFRDEGIARLHDISTYHVERLRAALLEENLAKDEDAPPRYRSRSTVNRYCQLLRGMFYRARDWDLYKKENPLRRVRFYREGVKIRPLTEDELRRVVEAARTISAGKRATPIQRAFHDIVCLILNTGLRRSEALGLRWAGVGDGELTVHGKGGKTRTIPLNPAALEVLARQARLGPLVFNVPNRSSCSVLRRTTEHVGRLAGVPFRLHLLRHSFASRLLASGVDIVTVSELLGHGKVAVSLLYSHTDPARKRAAVNGLSAV